jgi:hypothetical protein
MESYSDIAVSADGKEILVSDKGGHIFFLTMENVQGENRHQPDVMTDVILADKPSAKRQEIVPEQNKTPGISAHPPAPQATAVTQAAPLLSSEPIDPPKGLLGKFSGYLYEKLNGGFAMNNLHWNRKEAKEYYKAHEKQIKLFFKLCAKEDRQYYELNIKKLTEILRPYEHACIVKSSLTEQLLAMRDSIKAHGGEDALNVVSAQVRLNCPTAWHIFNTLDEPGIDDSDI